MDREELAGFFAGVELEVSPRRPVAENLAIDDEMTVTAAERGHPVLRLWWGEGPTVVLGRSENPDVVADLEACRRLGVPVVARRTGGGAVLQTPGVLNYAYTAPAPANPHVGRVFAAGALLLGGALARLGVEARFRGTSDLAVGDRKLSGNAQAWRRRGVLLHGTLLYDFDLDLAEACLRHPPREPDYRRGRGHRDFLTTLLRLGVRAEPPDVERAILATALELAAAASAAGAARLPC